MNHRTTTDARLAAVDAIAMVLDERCSLNDLPAGRQQLSERDRAFSQHLAYGVLRWLNALEWLAGRLLQKQLRRRDRDIYRLILIGLFQLWQEKTADHAAVHAAGESAKKLDKAWATGLVNAVLRRFQRERETLLGQLSEQEQRFAHPAWLLDELRDDWPEQWQDVAHQNNLQAPMWLRINRQKTERDAFVRLLADTGLETRLHDRAVDAVALHPPLAVGRIPGFANGLFSVQDPAAQLAADLVAPQAGERILDACAAPGGKTCHLLEREPDIRLLALDRDGQRLKLVRENLDRLGLNCELQTADAAQPDSWWDGKPFDRILLDAPCSTTGVIRRHPEIKWLRDPQQVGRAVELQRRLLDQLWPLLKRGGILVYATCSVLRCENHKQIHGFLSRHEPSAPAGEAIDRQHERQILPGEEQMDGFYYAVLHKPA